MPTVVSYFSRIICTVSIQRVKYLVPCKSQTFKFQSKISPRTQFKHLISRRLQMVDRATDHGLFLISFPTLCFSPGFILLTEISDSSGVQGKGGVSRAVLCGLTLCELVLQSVGLGDVHS